MRVLLDFVAPQANKLSGISVYTFRTFEALISRARNDYALLTNWDESAIPSSIADRIPVHSRPTSGRLPVLFMQGAYHAQRLAASLRPDVIFSTHPFGALGGGKARVAVMHDLYPETHPGFHSAQTRLIWKLCIPLVLARSQRIVCVSHSTKADLLAFHPGSTGKAVVVHEASPIGAADVEAAKLDAPPFPGRYGLIVANSAPTKNFDLLLAALAMLEREGLVVPVYWIGRDESGAVAAARSRLGELRSFVPVGAVDQQTLRAAYAHATVCLNTSIVEGFCLPLLEAQCLGAPVICSDIPVLREVAGNGAVFFDPADPAALAGALKDLWGDPRKRDQLRSLGYRNVSRFSWDRAAEELEQVFIDALA